jgi:hypothetical protein
MKAPGRDRRMRYTITHLPRRLFISIACALGVIVIGVSDAHAQHCERSVPNNHGFEDGCWYAEFATRAALEAWNYNTSHEEIYGLVQGISYGLRDGLALIVRQHLYYLSQRRNDSRVLGITGGLRGRLYGRGRASAFFQFDLGISDAAVAVPPRGTRFNYLALGGGGVLVEIRPRVNLISTLEVIHVSNASLKGPDRNPDIEAIGASLGVTIRLH